MDRNGTIWKKILGLKGLASVGFSDIIGGGMGAFFWFYIASSIQADEYGEISYFLGIAALVQSIACVGTANVVTVYVAKKVKIEATLYFISLVISFISSIILFFLLHRIDVSLLVFAFVINDLSIAAILGISSVTVGLTIVALGTSIPELFVTINSMKRKKLGVNAKKYFEKNFSGEKVFKKFMNIVLS